MIFVEGMNEILKIIKPSEDLGLFIDEIVKTIENEIRKKKKTISWYILGTLGASLKKY